MIYATCKHENTEGGGRTFRWDNPRADHRIKGRWKIRIWANYENGDKVRDEWLVPSAKHQRCTFSTARDAAVESINELLPEGNSAVAAGYEVIRL